MNSLYTASPKYLGIVLKESEEMRRFKAAKARMDRQVLIVACVMLVALYLL